MNGLHQLAEQIGKKLVCQTWQLGLAESCTGGLAAATITDLAGCSAWFDGSIVSYSNQSKQDLLAVPAKQLAEFGAVSEQVAIAMAQGVLAQGRCQIAASVTGIAGPSGGSAEKPVGTVCFAWVDTLGNRVSRTHQFSGSRQLVREQSIRVLFQGILQLLATY